MTWITNKWAQAGALILLIVSYLAFRDKRVRDDVTDKAKAQDNEKANDVRRRVDAIERMSDDDIEYRD